MGPVQPIVALPKVSGVPKAWPSEISKLYQTKSLFHSGSSRRRLASVVTPFTSGGGMGPDCTIDP